MSKVIIYKTDTGVSVVNPAPDCNLTIEQIAFKDVPIGKPFKIIDQAEVPTDTTDWIIDDAKLNSGIGKGVQK